jgi:hypothetical protein
VREILGRERVFFGGLASLGVLPEEAWNLPFAFGPGALQGEALEFAVLLLALGESITGGGWYPLGVLCQKGGRTFGGARGFLVLLPSCRENGSPPKLLRVDGLCF